MTTEDTLEAQSLAYLNKPCGTCYHRRGVHFKSYDGSHAGCVAEVGRDHPITCPCEGYMTTESEELRMAHLTTIGQLIFREVVARQDAEHGPLYRKAMFP